MSVDHPTQQAWSREDRDLLIELRTEMRAVRNDILEMKTNTAQRVSNLEIGKADKKEHDDVEVRLRRVERFGAMAIGGLLILEILLKFLPSILK